MYIAVTCVTSNCMTDSSGQRRDRETRYYASVLLALNRYKSSEEISLYIYFLIFSTS